MKESLGIMQLKIPYSKGKMAIDVPAENFLGVLESHPECKAQPGTQAEIVEPALDNAINSPKLEELTRGKNIESHFFAGFSGDRKAILPGIASAKTVMANHCSEFIKGDKARTGILDDNPIHRDMLHAAKEAKLAFILNVVINAEKEVIAAFAGDSQEAHVTGCDYVRTLAEIKRNPSDIVVSTNGGYPLDQNIYQAVKGMTAAEANCNEGGVIIMVAACNDGHDGESFYKTLKAAKTPRALLDQIEATPQEDTLPDQWEMQILARILDRFTVIMVTDLCDPQMIRDMHMEHALTFDEALKRAFEIKGKDAKVTVIPDGVSVIVR